MPGPSGRGRPGSGLDAKAGLKRHPLSVSAGAPARHRLAARRGTCAPPPASPRRVHPGRSGKSAAPALRCPLDHGHLTVRCWAPPAGVSASARQRPGCCLPSHRGAGWQDGKGQQERVTMLPQPVKTPLQQHLQSVKHLSCVSPPAGARDAQDSSTSPRAAAPRALPPPRRVAPAPPDRRRQGHALLAQRLIDVRHRAPSEAGPQEPHDALEPSPP
jgi:hypothetical protein